MIFSTISRVASGGPDKICPKLRCPNLSKSLANDWPHITVHAGCPEHPYIAFLTAVGAI